MRNKMKLLKYFAARLFKLVGMIPASFIFYDKTNSTTVRCMIHKSMIENINKLSSFSNTRCDIKIDIIEKW